MAYSIVYACVGGKNWTQEAEDKWVAGVRKFYGDDADEELDVIPAQGGGTYHR